MRIRPLALFVLTAGLAVLLGDSIVAGDAQSFVQDKKVNQDKKAKKQAFLEAKAAKAAEAAKAAAEAADLAKAKEVAAPKPAPITLPAAVKDPAALARVIDDHVARKLAAATITPSPACSDEEFLRRVYLDLTGVIPTGEKAKAFLDSTDPQKRAKLIDELLADPTFGRHLADIWQAKLLPRDSNNRFVQRDPLVKWLEESFNANTPWDQFVAKLVTATGTVEDNPAVTYFLANRSVDKLTDSVSQHFLGIQLQCAQCHNHPFTTWKQEEYWGMAAFFGKVIPGNPKNPAKGGDPNKLGVQEGPAKSKAKDFFPESAKVVPVKFLGGEQPAVPAAQPYRPVLAKWMTAPDNPYLARAIVNRTWAQLFGAGFVNPVDDMLPENEPTNPQLLDALALQFVANGYDLKHLYRTLCNTEAYQRTSKPTAANKDDNRLFSHMAVKVMAPEQLFDSLGRVTAAADRVAPAPRAAGAKGGPAGGRDGFVQFFLAGADSANPVEYEAGIPQALKLMNSRIVGNPLVVRQFFTPGERPDVVIERIYLATLSRRPTDAERAKLTQYVSKANTPFEAYGDILWAVLNSSEFTMVR